jgi:serine/threonine-protein kinase
VSRFLEEVKVTARLQHGNIVQVFDFDRLEDRTPFMVMERLRGRTLGAAMREARTQGKPWTAGNTFAVASQVAEGLSRAHANVPSIVHRDIKPENLYLHLPKDSRDWTVKVMDFGVAALVGAQEAKLIGTPRYMAPEQVDGGPVSPQTDQYAFALVVYEMLTGRLPWKAAGVKAWTDARLELPPTSALRFCGWLPDEVDRALLKALSRDPAKRHASVHALMFELRALEWVSEHTTGSGEYNATVPTVGTLAEGPPAFGGQDTVARMTVPPLEGPSRQAFEAGSMLQTRQDPRPLATGPDPASEDEATTGVVPPRPPTIDVFFEDLEAEAEGVVPAPASETPMTGEAVRSDGRGVPRRGMARVASAFAVAGAAATALGTLGAIAFSGRSHGKVDPPASSVMESTPSGPLTLEVKATPEPSPQDPAASASPLPAWIESASVAAAARTSTAPRDAVPTAARKPPSAASRPPARPAPAATHVPDDGRDELYAPGER